MIVGGITTAPDSTAMVTTTTVATIITTAVTSTMAGTMGRIATITIVAGGGIPTMGIGLSTTTTIATRSFHSRWGFEEVLCVCCEGNYLHEASVLRLGEAVAFATALNDPTPNLIFYRRRFRAAVFCRAAAVNDGRLPAMSMKRPTYKHVVSEPSGCQQQQGKALL